MPDRAANTIRFVNNIRVICNIDVVSNKQTKIYLVDSEFPKPSFRDSPKSLITSSE